jgi:hypothetical protein
MAENRDFLGVQMLLDKQQKTLGLLWKQFFGEEDGKHG